MPVGGPTGATSTEIAVDMEPNRRFKRRVERSPRSPDSVSFDPKPRQKDRGRGERPGVAQSVAIDVAAAGDDGSHPVIEWLAEVAQRVREPSELPGGNIMTEAALRAGLTVLFPRVSPGNHISARAQEFLVGEAVSFDARAVWLEAVFVTVTI